MREGRVALVIADLAGSTAMYEQLGDAVARERITSCLARLTAAAESGNGRVVKSLGDGLLCVFGNASMALLGALSMREAAQELGLVLRAGVHAGTVAEDDCGDVFGDAVNTVARVCDVAAQAEVLLTQEARDELPSSLAADLQPLPPVTLRGKRGATSLFALPAARGGVRTIAADHDAGDDGDAEPPQLVIGYGDLEWQCGDAVMVIGRCEDCDIVVRTARSSRAHAKVFRMGIGFYLADTSSNGTWLVTGQQPPFRLRRERLPLIGEGRIYCGVDPQVADAVPVTYRVVR